jgi:hypothetical protein
MRKARLVIPAMGASINAGFISIPAIIAECGNGMNYLILGKVFSVQFSVFSFQCSARHELIILDRINKINFYPAHPAYPC